MKINGRVLYLTKDIELIKKQIAGFEIPIPDLDDLMDDISTDEITPARVCFYYDQKLGDFCLVGLRGDVIGIDSIRNGNFEVIVSGFSKGCGSSRETAPYSELFAGIKLIVSRTIEKIYLQNCQNIGLYATTDFSILERINRKENIPISDLVKNTDPVSSSIIQHGGLFHYSKSRMLGENLSTIPDRKIRPMTITEKIIAKHVVVDVKKNIIGVDFVEPNDSYWIKTDVRFSHDYVTAMAEFIFKNALGSSKITNPESVVFFRDHLIFLDEVLSSSERERGILQDADKLAKVQQEFAMEQGIQLYNGTAICHLGIMEEIAIPSMVIIGTDSHTCTIGSLGSFSFGVGSTDMANAWYSQEVRITVPETIKIIISGSLPENVTSKDIMLKLFTLDLFRSGAVIGKVLEFSGDVIKQMNLDERTTLTNMSVEAGAFTGIIEADEKVVEYIHKTRGTDKDKIRKELMRSDVDAEYFKTVEIEASDLSPMVAMPGDPHNGIDISDLKQKVKIDIAYGGSCTGSKIADIEMYAKVLMNASKEGRQIAEGTEFYIQFGSEKIKEYAKDKGYIDLFKQFGVILLDPGCGACINSGPGISTNINQVTISSINRNYKGRSGPGKVYLSNPYVVAASALTGFIEG